MTDTALRRLAERAIADSAHAFDVRVRVRAQAILALLDERDHDRALIGTLAEDQALAERRVAALEEGLRRMVDEFDNKGDEDHGEYPACCTACNALDEARALLDPAALPADTTHFCEVARCAVAEFHVHRPAAADSEAAT